MTDARRALATGSARGIGRAIAVALAGSSINGATIDVNGGWLMSWGSSMSWRDQAPG